MHFHQIIYKHLIEYRNTVNKNFNFLVRQRASKKDKNYEGGKFAHGLVFQGNDNYCFVPLIDRSGGANATKSVGLVFCPDKENFKAHLEIVFPGETDDNLIKFYKLLSSKFENVSWDRNNQRAKIPIASFDKENHNVIFDWLDKNYQIIKETALKTGIENLIPNDERFDTLQENLKAKLAEAKIETINKESFLESLIVEFKDYLFTQKYADSTVGIYSKNFELFVDNYLKSNKIENLQISDYNYFIIISYNDFENATIESRHDNGKGHSHFISFFKNKIDAYELSNPTLATNQILYGPPGTGKTFYLQDNLFDKYTQTESSITKSQFLRNKVIDLSWWEVIAIALLDIKKAKVPDIRNHEWVKAKESLSNSNSVSNTLWTQLQTHTIDDCDAVKFTKRRPPQIFTKTDNSYWEVLEEEVKELQPELIELKAAVDNFSPNETEAIKNYEFVTFHQSFAYEDFIEGIKPVLPKDGEEESSELNYTIEDGVFKKLCLKAEKNPEHKYAIFIDEINRGNISAIFGELITLIEVDKRKDAENELSLTLPYSKKTFSVPQNIDIIGTMNTADRSVEALDSALRRRFEFKEMMPDYEIIQDETVDNLDISLAEILKKINQRIELLIDRDHSIGHSYFYGIDTPEELADAFNNKIVPLLQEYFYGDYGKIGLVLGEGFVTKQKNDTVDFAKFDYENAADFKTPSFILKKVDGDSIINAVELIMRTAD